MISSSVLSRLDIVGYELFCSFSSVVWQSSLLFVVAFLVSWILRHRSNTVKHAIWVGALVIMPLLPAVTWMINLSGSPVTEIKVLPDQAFFEEISITESSVPVTKPPIPEAANSVTVQKYTVAAESFWSRLIAGFGTHVWAGVFIAYLVLAGGFLFLTMVVFERIRSMVRTGTRISDDGIIEILERIKHNFGISRDIGIVESTRITVPITCGLFHPVVLLPTGFTGELSDEDRAVVLAHELSHVKRNDPLILMLLTVIRSIFFFHPLVWFAAKEASYYAECACDISAFGYTGTPHSYAEMLGRVAQLVRKRTLVTEYAVGFFASKKNLQRRISDILQYSGKLKHLSKGAQAVIFISLILSVSIVASFPVSGKSGKASPLFKEFELLSVTQDTTTIRDFLRNNPQLKRMRDLDGQSLCNYIISDTQATTLRILLEEGFPFDIPDNRGMTPLRKALQFTNKECLRLLIEHGADPDKKDSDGLRPLEYVLEGGVRFTRYSLNDMLVEHGAEVTIHTASLLGDIERVRAIIDDDPSAVNDKNREGRTALHLLCNRQKRMRSNPEMDKILDEILEKSIGKGRLAYLKNNCFEIIKILLEHNADPEIRDDYGWMPIHYAVKQGRHEEAALLLDAGTSVNAKTKDGDTPLHIAVWDNREETVRTLIEYGADINAVNSYGTTPLSWAKFQKYSSISEILNDNDAEDTSENLDRKKTWKRLRKSPYSEKALGAHLLAEGNYDIAGLASATPPLGWYIRKALRLKRKGGDDYSCIEISFALQGDGMPQKMPDVYGGGCIYIFDSMGNILHASNDRLFLPENLLLPNALERNYNMKFLTLANNEKWIDVPDLNGDGYSDFPRQEITRDSNLFKIYSSHSNDFPLIFESELQREPLFDPRVKITENMNISEEIILQHIDKPSPSLRIAAMERRKIYNARNSYYYVRDDSAVPRELARYEWDTGQNKYTGPQKGPDGLWEIKYPNMADHTQ